ncbi:hypothetical protein DVDV_3789 [Desulfovibrio sp. DV]|uniref:DUF6599 family protein n=1 Tax=Desulfovibrio sp. DV TaxID=1844708 RepID=UPI00094BAFFA|nr:DUF6599 family protein [Desulfovibrio sp. DV]OLN24931.1 hypothetical protein DVDV_3789 [Desulfovibrio sp. DV]
MVVSRPGLKNGQRAAARAVLAGLAAIAVWLGVVQSQPNPAVLVALAPPKIVGAMAGGPADARQFATAAFLNALAGAKAASAVESYDAVSLSDRIDGKAELYLAANFKEMSCRAMTLPNGARLDVYVYAQATPADAFAVLSAQRRQGSRPLPALAPDAYATPNALYFTRAGHYVEITADRADPDTMAGLETLGAALFAALPAEAPAGGANAAPRPDPKTLFPTEGLAADSLRLAAADAMGMAGFSNVYTAEYALPAGAATALLAARDSPEQAAGDARAFADFLRQNGYAVTPLPPDAPGLAADAVLLEADGSHEILWTRGAMLAGVHDAANRPAALALAAALDKALDKAGPEVRP